MVNLGKDSDPGSRKSRGRQRRKSDSVGNKEGKFPSATFEHALILKTLILEALIV